MRFLVHLRSRARPVLAAAVLVALCLQSATVLANNPDPGGSEESFASGGRFSNGTQITHQQSNLIKRFISVSFLSRSKSSFLCVD